MRPSSYSHRLDSLQGGEPRERDLRRLTPHAYRPPHSHHSKFTTYTSFRAALSRAPASSTGTFRRSQIVRKRRIPIPFVPRKLFYPHPVTGELVVLDEYIQALEDKVSWECVKSRVNPVCETRRRHTVRISFTSPLHISYSSLRSLMLSSLRARRRSAPCRPS